MPTIYDVAKRAGVAPITVSRVINHRGYFSPETRQRVEAAIDELGYVPNSVARSLRSKRTHTLGLVLTDITNPFFTTLARGVEDTANREGYSVFFCNTDESEVKEQKYLQLLLQKQVDGVLLVSARCSPGPVRLLQSHGTPVVLLDRKIPQVEVDVVRCDSEQAAYRLTNLLLSLGHRDIAMLSGPEWVSTAVDRVAGYRRAFQEAGESFDSGFIYHGDFTQESGSSMTRRALEMKPAPTALLAANNFITIGAMKTLQELGLRVPEQISLAGFDDLPIGLVPFPFFTVAAQPAYEMGQRATQLLLKRLSETPQVEECTEILLPIEVIERKSTARLTSEVDEPVHSS